MKKLCSSCKTDKALSEFPKNTATKDGMHSWCRSCSKVKKQESNQRVKERDPEAWKQRWRTYKKSYKDKHPERLRAYDRQKNLKDKFGMSVEEYDIMAELQSAQCAICGLPCPTGKRLAVDHDHETGKIRALLCAPCNLALGQLEPDDRLRKAVEYLEVHSCKL